MRMKENYIKKSQLKSAYNPQIFTNNQYILHYSIHHNPIDTKILKFQLAVFEQHYNRTLKELVADAGYGSQENYNLLKSKIKPYV